MALYAGALMLLSDRAGEALLGASWAGAQDLVPPIAALTAATGLNATLGALLRLLAPRATLSLRLASAALMPPLFACGYVLAGVQGAAWGLAAAAGAQTVLLAWQLARQMASAAPRVAQTVPSASQFS